MKIPSPVAGKRARIEIIPLIDIVFFLLATFVMVSLSMVQNEGVSVNLPVASTSTAQDVSDIVTISITEDGTIYMNKDAVSPETLSEQLSVLKTTNTDLKVLINGDENTRFGAAIKVLDTVRNLGITKVAIRTQSDS